jgi:hypothetical protein
MDSNISYEERIKQLEERVSVLEKIEQKRRTRRIISICIKVFFYLLMIGMIIGIFLYVKPYFDQLSGLTNGVNNFNIDNYLNDLNGLLGY